MNKEILKIGIPSKGRISLESKKILKNKNLKIYSERGERDLLGKIKNKPNIQILYLHAREIIDQINFGNLDVGISGYDLLQEADINVQKNVGIIKKLNFAHARLVLAVREEWIDCYTTLDLDEIANDFRKKNKKLIKIGTKYPNNTRDFLYSKGVTQFEIVKSLGATELMPGGINTASVVSDITSSGATLKANKLKILNDGEILQSQACLLVAKKNQNKKGIKNLIKLIS